MPDTLPNQNPPATPTRSDLTINQLLADIYWISQTVHRAHHDGDWETCPKSTCACARAAPFKARGDA